MVVDDASLDRLFHALADATRRDILARSIAGEESVSALARRYPISLTAVQKHIDVLQRADLITKERRGREQRVRANTAAVARARAALDHLEATWRDRLHRIDALIKETQ
jgi:DNA-binding transcriptional ArsR family regulator